MKSLTIASLRIALRPALFSVAFIAAALCGPLASAENPLRIGYSFNEGTNQSGGATDYYGVLNGSWNGTWSGSTYFRPGASGEDGDFAITSGGNRVRVPLSTVIGEEWGSFTIETHFTIGEAGSFRRLVHIDPLGVALQKNGSNQLRMGLQAEEVTTVTQTEVLEEERWYHVALTYDADAAIVTMYLDGELVGSADALPWQNAEFLYLGASHTGGAFWNGHIDNFRFTQAILTPDEFLLEGFGTNLVEPPPLAEPSLQIGFGFNEGSAFEGSPVTDFYGNRDGVYTFNWAPQGDPSVYFHDGFSGESDDYSITPAGNVRVTVDLAEALGEPLGTESFTLEINAIMTDETSNWARALHLFGGPSLVQRQSNASSIRFGGMTANLDVPVPMDEWFHIAWIYDAETQAVSVYVDGQLRGGNPVDPAVLAAGTLVIGSTDAGGSTWGAPLDDFRFSNAALSPQQFLLGGFGPDLTQPPAGSPFLQWRESQFAAEELNDETVSGPDAAPAGDGIPNLLKFALGLDAKTPSRARLPQASRNGETVQLGYSQANEATDVDVVVEISADLVSWNSGPEHVEIERTNTSEAITVTATPTSAYAESDRVFLRLRAVSVD